MSKISEHIDSLSAKKRALLALRVGSKIDLKEPLKTEPVAIIGMGCRFPGARNPETFWRLLRDGVDAITEIPPDRWNADAYYDPDRNAPGKMITRWGGFLEEADRFDPLFFNISPREAESMDPQQRLLMEVSWEALENAGQPVDRLAGSQTGVFIGIMGNDYLQFILKYGDPLSIDSHMSTGNSFSIAAGRLSYFLGLQGPSMAVDTACSSSSMAVHLACQSLNSGECHLALAGGVNLVLSPEITIMLSKVGLLGSHPCCKTFDAEADGFVRGEGCGIVVLKRLSDALADGDNILAVLRSTAVNQDGRSSGLTAPNERAHKAVIREALNRAGVEPSRVSYVEAHGTASRLGDAVELQALGKVLGKGRSENQHLFVGSVKTNVGHLESASGMAAIIKVVLSLIHGEIPPHLHLKEMNPLISLEDTPVVIPMERIPWPSENGRHIAGVNAFGFSGTNAFMVIEEAPVRQEVRPEIERPLHLLTLSANSEKALMKLVKRFETHLGEHASESLSDICFTANAGRSHFPYRLADVVESSKQLRERIGAFAAGTKPTGLVSGHVQTGSRPKVAFLFSGQGCQYVGMGRQLYYTQPTFRKALDRCAEILKSQIDRPLFPVIFEKKGESSVSDETGYAQPALFALEYSLSEMWQSWGIDPFVVMGHDEGEYVAACVAGVFSLEDGLKLIAARSRMTVAQAQKNEGNAMPASLKERISEVNFSAPRFKMISGITGELADINELRKPEYWWYHDRNHAQFLSGIEKLHEQGYNVFIEIGSDPILIKKGQKYLSEKAGVLLPSLKKGREDWQQLLESLSELYVRGLDVDWSGFDRGYARHRIPLPTYPFERERYWISRPKVSINKARTAELTHPLLGYRVHTPFKEILFESQFSSNAIFFDQHRVYDLATMAGSTFLQMAIAGAGEAFGEEVCVVENMTVLKALHVLDESSKMVQLMFIPEDSGIASFKIFSMKPNGDGKQASWTLHATGKLRVGRADNTTSVPEDVSLEEIKARCLEEIPASEFYREMLERGLQLGHYFKWNEKIWRGDQDVLAQMRSPTTGDQFETYQIHPGLIDSCGQLLISLTSKADSVYMFVGCDSYRFYGRPDGQLWCHVVLETGDPEQEVISGKYRLFNEFGQVVAEVTGVHSKRVTREALESIIRRQDISDWSSKDERLSAERAEFLHRMKDMLPEERMDLVLARIRSNVVEVLRLDPSKSLDSQQPLTELGLNSLLILELKNRLETHMGVDLPLADFLKSPNVENMANLALRNLPEPSSLTLSSSAFPQITPALDKRHLPFPLTDVQRAYWIGRSEAFELGNVPCHVYMEVELTGFDVDRFNQAFLRVIKRHDMLRAVILPDGLQQVLKEVPPYKIEILDIRGQNPEKVASHVEAIRSHMSYQEFAVDRWPLYEIRASLLDDQRTRLHISIDFLIADGLSFMIIIQELAELYRNPEISLPLLDLTFRDYVLAERDLRDSDIYQRFLDYWRGRLESIPPAPELPISKNPGSVTHPRFKRRSAVLDQERWLRLKSRGGRAGLTPSGVLLAAFAEILAAWSKSPRFTINVTIFNRFPLHPHVDQIVGDFTRLILLAVEDLGEETFELRARAIQQQLWKDMEHSYVSGVQVMTDMGRSRGENARVYMPVVFTSLLPLGTSRYTQAGFLPAGIPLDVIYCISQTPQVWLDYQVVEKDGALVVIWDAVEDLFPKGLLDDMLEAHCHFLKCLAEKEEAWQETTRQLIPAAQLKKRAVVNATEAPISSEMLHTLFANQVLQQPDHLAVISSNRTLSYEELSNRSNHVGRLLREKGAQPNALVAVVMEKGWEQVVAVLGILNSGAAYLPIDPELPKERLWHLLDDGEVSLVLTQSWLDEKLEWPEGIQRFSTDKQELTEEAGRPLDPVQKPEDLTYVIYTSGSTGLPKGVMIDHRGAVNTILDVNQRFGIGSEDRVIALSNLNFDLSVSDIFGTLAAGGTIVLPESDKTKDPAHWLELMEREQVTVWNSVPALMQMLVEYVSGKKEVVSQSLRLVLLSGDWIPLDLPDKVKALVEGVQVISLGGATEASIWSNLYPIEEVDPNWKSIPYGRPMVSQRFYVLNEFMEDCPDWVPSQLYIGGIGLAKGYWQDEEKTKDSFIVHPRTGERLYRTGDVGRYLPDGNIEFLGREDFQVKIRGYRIELGEIETTLKQHPGVRDAVVTAAGYSRGSKHLVGYVVPDQEKVSSLFETQSADPEKIQARWASLVEAGGKQAQQVPKEINPQAFPVFGEYMEHLSVVYMCRALENVGAFINPGERHTAEGLIHHCGIQPRYRKLVEQWLEILEEEGLLKRDGKDAFVNHRALPTDPSDMVILQEVKQYPKWNEHVQNLLQYLQRSSKYHAALLRGEVDPLELFFSEELLLSPEDLIQLLPGTDYRNSIARELLEVVTKGSSPPKPLRILEVGARAGSTTELLLSVVFPDQTIYTYTDSSAFFTNKAKNKFKDYSFVQYQLLDIDQNPQDQGYDAHSYDVIIASNSLHRARNIGATLQYMQSLLAPGGLLFILETTRNSRLQKISVGFIEEGFTHFEDERVKKNLPLLSVEKWQKVLQPAEFVEFVAFPESSYPTEVFGQHVMVAQAPSSVKRFKQIELSNFLEEKLPEYMVPSVYMLLDALPLTPNGKVDRQALPTPEDREKTKSERTIIAPRTPIEISLADIWGQILEIERMSIHDNFFQLGGDSLLGIQLTSRIRNEFGVELPLQILFGAPTIAKLSERIQALVQEHVGDVDSATLLPQIIATPDQWHLPFPLTDIQQAYWIGRSGVYELGNVATHSYFEIEGADLDLERINMAWQRLIDHHGMMRAVILPDGQQQKILKQVPPYQINILDLRGEDQKTVESELTKIRDEMSHQMLSTDDWPLFDVRASCFGKERVRLHVSFDNLIFDGWSMFHLLNEWSRLYEDPDASLSSLDLSFRDYILAVEKLQKSESYEHDQEYWFGRLHSLPPAPELPLAQNPRFLIRQSFNRLDFRLDHDTWQQLKHRAAQVELTPSGILLAAYAEVLSIWSKSPLFTINLTLFNRLPLHPQVNEIIGDFTSLTLLAVDNSLGKTFVQRARNLQQQLWQDLDHPYVGGVQVLRELARLRGELRGAVMPVVFTSALGVDSLNEDASGMNWMGKLVYNITQTPQVWLDHQVIEQDRELLLIWDAVEGLFPDGFLDDMFDAYCNLLKRLADEEEAWQETTFKLIPGAQLEKRIAVNATEASISSEMLQTLFANQVPRQPDHPAVISSNRTLSYEELSNRSNQVGHLLREKGAQPNTLVAVVMEKGWEQVVAVLGILQSGAAYLPIDPAIPRERLQRLLEDGKVSMLLTQSWLEESLEWPKTVQRFSVDKMDLTHKDVRPLYPVQGPEDLAYVIYTSGSTGLPKGVMIDHRGAVNTIMDVNQRFNVGSEDRVLAISSLNFDLSVYDIFGTLAAGGTIVLPESDKTKDPAHWLELMTQEQVTIWNSVPALMQMLVEYVSGRKEVVSQSLRLVLLSGDWIPLDLPDKVKALADDVQVIGLGGATEASIWSNLYPIKEVDPNWKSIPYGRPMVNQRFYVLNELMEDCPDWVPSQLYIGGIGLAKGYWQDEEKTQDSFIVHPRSGERLYRTGDLGRYLPDGNLEFLGREDFQVKISGYRIELGEIEAALKEHPEVSDAVVTAVGDPGMDKRLVGYVVPNGEEPSTAGLKSFLKEKLPEYMVPSAFVVLDAFPLTFNGKVDRKALPKPGELPSDVEIAYLAPRTEVEQTIATILQELLDIEKIGTNDNFFDVGANSLHLVRAQNKLRDAFGRDISVLNLFEYTTISALAEYLSQDQDEVHFLQQAHSRAGIRKAARKKRKRAKTINQQISTK